MSIIIGENTVGMWQLEFQKNEGNWLAHIARVEDGTFQLDYRFRYYVDSKMGKDSNDRWSWFGGKLTGKSEQQVIEGMRNAFEMLKRVRNPISSWELLKGQMTASEFADALLKMPCMHISPEELH